VELARDDAGDVEEIFDELRQHTGVALDHLGPAARARGIERARAEQAHPPEDRVQRCPELVRERRQEFVLGAIGLVQLAPRVFQITDDDLVGAHVAQDADGADGVAVRVAQRRRVEGGGDHFARGAARIQPSVAGDAAGDDLTQHGRELPRFVHADEARQRLLDDLGRPKSEQCVDGVVGLQDFALQVGDEDRIGRVLDEALGVGARLVELAHVAQDADDADNVAVRTAQAGGVERGRNDFAGGAARVQPDVARDAALDDFAKGDHELPGLVQADEA